MTKEKTLFFSRMASVDRPDDFYIEKIIMKKNINKKHVKKNNDIPLLQCDKLAITSFSKIEKFFSEGPLSKYTRIKILKCRYNKLTDVDDISSELLRNLEEIDVSNNLFKTFRSFMCFKKLKRLICYNNRIVSFDGIEFLGDLEYLDCSFNEIKDTFGPLKNLKKIKKFICFLNNIEGSFLPLRKCTHLQYLSCSNNGITSESFHGLETLAKLKNLDVSRNKIKGSFVGLVNLAELVRLDWESNKISSFKGFPPKVDDGTYWNNPILNRYIIYTNHYNTFREYGGTSKFVIFKDIIMDNYQNSSYIHWLDKNDLNKLYDYFYFCFYYYFY